MKVKKLILGFFSVNCYILQFNSDECIIIDPGADYESIRDYLESNKLSPLFILNTHGHYDHIGAVKNVIKDYNIPFYIHEIEEDIVQKPDHNMSSAFGGQSLSLDNYRLITEENFKEGKRLGLEVKRMPGHTPGSIIIRYKNLLFTGDLLFKNAIGRTDLPGGSAEEIKESLINLSKMDKNLLIYPGHGGDTSLEFELDNNYYLSKRFLG